MSSVPLVVLALGTAQKPAWIHTNPTMNALRAVLKIHSGQIPEMGWACPVPMPDPSRAQTSGKPYWEHSRQPSIWGVGVYFILILMRRSNPAPCTSAVSWKEAFLLPAHQRAAKHLHFHFMDEERELERHQFPQGHTRLLTATRLAHVQPTGQCCIVYELPPEIFSQPVLWSQEFRWTNKFLELSGVHYDPTKQWFWAFPALFQIG